MLQQNISAPEEVRVSSSNSQRRLQPPYDYMDKFLCRSPYFRQSGNKQHLTKSLKREYACSSWNRPGSSLKNLQANSSTHSLSLAVPTVVQSVTQLAAVERDLKGPLANDRFREQMHSQIMNITTGSPES